MLQSFDQNRYPGLNALYEAANALLRDAGILQQLRAFPLPRQTPRSTAATTPIETAAQTSPSATGAATQPAAHSDHIAVLENLRELLAQRRTGHTGDKPGTSYHAASPDELQLALSAVQQHVSAISNNASRELRSAQRLREELLIQLNAGKPAGAPLTQLSPEQGDTVELMAMLFEQLQSADAARLQCARCVERPAGADAAHGRGRPKLLRPARAPGPQAAGRGCRSGHRVARHRRQRGRPFTGRQTRTAGGTYTTGAAKHRPLHQPAGGYRTSSRAAGAQGADRRTPARGSDARPRTTGTGTSPGSATDGPSASANHRHAACCGPCSSAHGPTCWH